MRSGLELPAPLWIRGCGALSLRLRAQTLSRTGRGWVALVGPAKGRAGSIVARPVRDDAGAGESPPSIIPKAKRVARAGLAAAGAFAIVDAGLRAAPVRAPLRARVVMVSSSVALVAAVWAAQRSPW